MQITAAGVRKGHRTDGGKKTTVGQVAPLGTSDTADQERIRGSLGTGYEEEM